MLTYGAASYIYGKRGDLQQKVVGTDATFYNYDNLGNLRSVMLPDGTLIEYIIDGLNRRVGKKVNGAFVKRWIYQDQLNPVAELDTSGNVSAKFVYGSKINVPDYMIKNDTTYAIVTDHLGSVRLVVNTQSGEIRQRMDYDEYGNILLDTNPGFQPFGFAGGLYDSDIKLIRFGARDYDPQTGRWTAKDPILFDSGTSNLYEYALNAPINNVDQGGLQSTAISDRFSGLRERARKDPWGAAGAFYGAANSITGAEHIATMEGRACPLPRDEERAGEILVEGTLMFATGPILNKSWAVLGRAAYSSRIFGVGSKLFGIGRSGLPKGILNSGRVRLGWSYIKSTNQHTFRIAVGNNPRFYPATEIFGKPVHFHFDLFKVPATF